MTKKGVLIGCIIILFNILLCLLMRFTQFGIVRNIIAIIIASEFVIAICVVVVCLLYYVVLGVRLFTKEVHRFLRGSKRK